jgi:hypothetical protein
VAGALSADEFWSAAASLIERGEAEPGTIMGGECLRAGGEFVAMPHHTGEGMVVKLPAARVAELIEQDTGEPFAPAGRVFREWVLVRHHDGELWRALLSEAHAFVSS